MLARLQIHAVRVEMFELAAFLGRRFAQVVQFGPPNTVIPATEAGESVMGYTRGELNLFFERLAGHCRIMNAVGPPFAAGHV